MSQAAAQSISPTKRKLLDAATRLMLRQGYTATTVDQVCGEAGVTKGSFFHYFKSKEQIGEAAIDYFSCWQQDAHAKAPFNQAEDPLERLLGMLDFVASMANDPDHPKACLVGNLAQELSETNPEMRRRCEASFRQWTAGVASLLEAAKVKHRTVTDFEPQSVATMMLSLLQGSLLVAKARDDCSVIVNNLRHCRAYVSGLFETVDQYGVGLRHNAAPQEQEARRGSVSPASRIPQQKA